MRPTWRRPVLLGMMMATDAAPAVTPPEGWCDQSPFGVLKTACGERLARLEDVHAWLMRRDGMPSASAVARVFGVFVSDANSEIGMKHGAAKVRASLYLTDLSGYAESVRGFAGRFFLREMANLVPYVPHHHFDRGTVAALMYSLGLMAGEVWAPHEVEIDLNDRLDGYCAEGYFPTVAKAREVLGRFAVPFAMAHELWGWGTVAMPDAAPVPASAAALADPLAALDVSLRQAFDAVCKRRASSNGAKNGAREAWLDADVETVRQVKEALGRSGARTIAPLLYMEANGLRELLRRKAKPTHESGRWAGLGERNKAA